jgi:hypothetical protein
MPLPAGTWALRLGSRSPCAPWHELPGPTLFSGFPLSFLNSVSRSRGPSMI